MTKAFGKNINLRDQIDLVYKGAYSCVSYLANHAVTIFKTLPSVEEAVKFPFVSGLAY